MSLTVLSSVVADGVNAAVVDAPEKVNEDPYGEGWLVKIRLSEPGEVDDLLDAARLPYISVLTDPTTGAGASNFQRTAPLSASNAVIQPLASSRWSAG